MVREQVHCDVVPKRLRFNLRVVAKSNRGFVFSAAQCARSGAGHVGIPCTLEKRQKIGAANKGRVHGPHSLETRAKIGAWGKGRVHTPEALAKMRAAWETRFHGHTPEACVKMSASHKARAATPEGRAHFAKVAAANRMRIRTPEYRARMRVALKGRLTPEGRAKIVAANKGIPRSPEIRAKIKASLAARRVRLAEVTT